MPNISEDFSQKINEVYQFPGLSFKIGSGMLDKQVQSDTTISIPLKTLNRHGLIAGTTGTGKTKTLQLIAEGLSEAGVPTLLMDIKDDLSGLAASGVNSNMVGKISAA